MRACRIELVALVVVEGWEVLVGGIVYIFVVVVVVLFCAYVFIV